MRISDWSSDVCSSDLAVGKFLRPTDRPLDAKLCRPRRAAAALGSEQVVRVEPAQAPCEQPAAQEVSGCQRQIESVGRKDRVVDDRNGSKKLDDPDDIGQRGRLEQLGRASCRERVCQYV